MTIEYPRVRSSTSGRTPAALAMLAVGSIQWTAQAQSVQLASETEVLEELVVTARRREERLQDTPVSVTAFTTDALSARGIGSSMDLGQHTANLVSSNGSAVSGNNSAGSYFIRGIGQLDFTLNTDPGVGLYVDDVYMARAMGSVMDLLDLRSIEVLRGPQGTLFGRNTIGGAISLRSTAPSQQGKVSALTQFGSDHLARAQLVADIPLAQTLLTRVAAGYTKQDGFVRRVVDGVELGDKDSAAVRVAARWLPSDIVTADLVLDGSRRREESPPTVATALDGASAFGAFHNAVVSGALQCLPPPGSQENPACFNNQFLTSGSYATNATFHSQSDLDAWGAALTVNVEPGSALRVKSITAYRNTRALGFRDGDNSPHVIAQTQDTWDHEQFSQELQLIGATAGGVLEWIGGLYYFAEQGTNINLVDFAPIRLRSGGSVDNDSSAIFGQATWHATSALSLTAGLRYTEETKRFDPDQFVIEDRNPDPARRLPPGFALVPPEEVATSIDEATPYLNLAYQWSDDFMSYVAYSEGFKSGGFTQRVFPPLPATPAFKPEFVHSYEAGAKLTAFDQRLRVNAGAFHTDYTDLQVLALVGVAPTTQNAAAARIRGFELELSALPLDDLRVEAAVGYVDAQYTSIGQQVVGLTVHSEFAQVPRWTGSAAASYRLAVGAAALVPRVDWSYHSDVYMDAANTPQLHQPGYGLLGASLTWLTSDERWQVRLAGTNLTNERYFTAGFADLPVSGIAEVVMARPRQWSLQVSYQH